MWARSFVMTAAMTRFAAPFANSARAICSIIRAVVRSDIPIATAPLPMISTSPPSSDASPKSSALNRSSSPSGGYQYSKSWSGEHRVGLVDRGHVEGLATAGRPVHRVDRDAAVDPARRVAREQRVGQRRQDERRLVVERGRDQRRRLQLAQVEPGFADGQAADQMPRERVRRQLAEGLPDRLDEADPDDVLRRDEVGQPLPGVLARAERLAQQVLDVEDLDAPLAHPGDELVVLPLGPLDPQDVVEQQLVVVARRQPLQAEVRAMDDDLAELADLGVDAERCHWNLRPPCLGRCSCRRFPRRAPRSGPVSRSRPGGR